MPAKISPYRVAALDRKEREKIAKLAAKAGLSVSNWFRRAAGLAPVEHGGARDRVTDHYCENCEASYSTSTPAVLVVENRHACEQCARQDFGLSAAEIRRRIDF